MNTVIIGAVLTCGFLGLAFYYLFRNLSSHRTPPITLEWITELSASRYHPMERLLDEEDFRFLSAQPGFSRKMLPRLRAERRRAFRAYLHSLNDDFNRACSAIKFLMLHSATDRPDLAAALLKQRFLFALGITAVQFRLALHVFGVSPVDVRNLIGALDSVQIELRQLIPAVAAQPAVG